MMATIEHIYDFLNKMAPFSTQEPWDNSGLLVESRQDCVKTVLLALDITPEVVEEAHELQAELVLSHHPVIFEPRKRLCRNDPATLLAHYGIGALCAHTNLDLAEGGLNDMLAQRLQLQEIAPLGLPNPTTKLSLGRIGNLPKGGPDEIVAIYIRKNVGAKAVQFVRGPAFIRRVALCTGAGGDLMERAAQMGADVFVTGEVKHHELLLAKQLGIALVAAGHYATEHIMVEALAERLRTQFPEVQFCVSQREQDPVCFV